MKYSELICFDPIESVIQLTEANDSNKAARLVKSYVMSDNMAEQIKRNMLSQLSLDDVVDNKGVLLVGNYGTGKSHLMSVISALALDGENLTYLQNPRFAEDAKTIAGRFEVVRIEIGAVTTPLREIILSKVQEDFELRGISFEYPSADNITNNKETLLEMMRLFGEKYPDKGYLIVVDEFLDFLGSKDDHAVRFDLGFMRELGEIVKESRMRTIFGVQEKLFDNPAFSFVSQSINRVRDRFEQVVIRKEDTAYVVSERILKKTDEQKAIIRNHLQRFCSLYSNMSERIEEYVSLFPIHPSYIEVFNKIYIIENRHILANISKIIDETLSADVPDEAPGVFSFDSYWPFIKSNFSYRTEANIKEVVEKSGQLEDIINRSFPKKQYKPLALKIINALSVHRLTTGDIQLRAGLTSENLRDDLCLYISGLPDQSSDTLQSLVQTVLKDIMTTVSGQFIDLDSDNGQYYLDLKKDVDYDEKIAQRAATFADDSLNKYFYDIIYYCLDWDEKEYVSNFKIYEHTLNWDSHNVFRRGYLFLGTPESRPTAQPPKDYYIYFVPPYGNTDYEDEKKQDEAFFVFKESEDFKNDLRLYAAAIYLRNLAEEKNRAAYQDKADVYKRKLTHFLTENKNTCFEVFCAGTKRQPLEVMKGRYKADNPFKETVELVASLLFGPWFEEKYSEFPVFQTTITLGNQADAIRRAYDRFAGRKEELGNKMLDSFGLLSGENISITNSKYALYYAKQLEKLTPETVLNFGDIYEEVFQEKLDKKFSLNHGLLPIVLLALVYAGRAVVTLKDGKTMTASNLDELPRIGVTDIQHFRHIGKPKELQLGELVRLFEVLDLPEGLIRNEKDREKGVVELLAKTKEVLNAAVSAKHKLDGDFSLWGEPLVATHIASTYKESIKRVNDELSNFGPRFNTVAKLNNFMYSMDDVETLGKGIAVVNTVLEYDAFRTELSAMVDYMMSIESAPIGDALKQQIETAKESFRKARDNVADNFNGNVAAIETSEVLAKIRDTFIDLYFQEHKKHRLDIRDGQRKNEIIHSLKFANLKRLAEIENILLPQKLVKINEDLAALNVCIELTPEALKTVPICQRCGYQLGSNEPLVNSAIEDIENRLESLVEEWTNTLLNTISDSLVLFQKDFLSADQQKTVDDFIQAKVLPEKVDSHFVSTVNDLLKGFDVVTISGQELIDVLTSLGPLDTSAFKAKIEEIVAGSAKGKDETKLRIIVR